MWGVRERSQDQSAWPESLDGWSSDRKGGGGFGDLVHFLCSCHQGKPTSHLVIGASSVEATWGWYGNPQTASFFNLFLTWEK